MPRRLMPAIRCADIAADCLFFTDMLDMRATYYYCCYAIFVFSLAIMLLLLLILRHYAAADFFR